MDKSIEEDMAMGAAKVMPRIILGSASKTRQAILREMGYNDFIILKPGIDEAAIRRDKAEDLVMALAEAKADALLARLSYSGGYPVEEDGDGGIQGRRRGGEAGSEEASVDEFGREEEEKTRQVVRTTISVSDAADAAAAAAAADLTRGGRRSRHVASMPSLLLITADQVVIHEGLIREKPTTPSQARLFIEGYGRSPACTVGAVVVTDVRTGFRKGGVDKAEVYFHPIPPQVVDQLIKEGSVFQAAGGLLVEHPLVSPLVEAMVGTLDSVMGLPKALTSSLINDVLAESSSSRSSVS